MERNDNYLHYITLSFNSNLRCIEQHPLVRKQCIFVTYERSWALLDAVAIAAGLLIPIAAHSACQTSSTQT